MSQRAAEEEQRRVIAAASQDLLTEMRAAAHQADAHAEVQNGHGVESELDRVEFRLAITEMQQEEALAVMQRRHAEAVQELQSIRTSEDEVYGTLAEDPS